MLQDKDRIETVDQTINRYISLWEWSLAMAFYFPFAQVLSVLGSENPGFESHVWIIFLMQALAGALLGLFLALGARAVVKAIRC